MKLLRDLSGDDLAKALARIGYRETRQIGEASTNSGGASAA